MELSERQARFVSILVETGSRATAAQITGLDAKKTLNRGAVVLALRKALEYRLYTAAPMALIVLENLAFDTKIPPAVRRMAASDLLDRAGLVSQAAVQLAQPIESLSEMPAKNLRALVERLETELFSRSTPVRALELESPVATPDDAKPLSVLD